MYALTHDTAISLIGIFPREKFMFIQRPVHKGIQQNPGRFQPWPSMAALVTTHHFNGFSSFAVPLSLFLPPAS